MNRYLRTSFSITLSCLFLVNSLPAQQLSYEVFAHGKKIGEMKITQTDVAGAKHYILNGITNFKILWWEMHATLTVQTVFDRDGQFASSSLLAKRDDKVRLKVNARRNGNEVLVERDDEKVSLSKVPHFAQLPLYFKEPANISELFSERLGELVAVKHLGNHRYTAPIMSLNGVYTYVDGILTEVEASSALGTLRMKLVK